MIDSFDTSWPEEGRRQAPSNYFQMQHSSPWPRILSANDTSSRPIMDTEIIIAWRSEVFDTPRRLGSSSHTLNRV